MKKLLAVFLGAIILFSGVVFAVDYKSNSYQLTTYLDSIDRRRGVDFTPATRDLIIRNAASSATIYIDLDSSATTSCTPNTEGCFLLDEGESITLRNFMTEGISILPYEDKDASDVTIIATW